jgi:O-succinylbenzoic acid--CoA ligase
VTSRPLHAVLLPRQAAASRLFDALGAALDGTGPAIVPLDASLPRARLDELITAFSPSVIETDEDLLRLAPAGHRGHDGGGVAEDIAVVLATSGSTALPKGAELTGSALLASARASLARLGGGEAPGGRWLCCLPLHHVSGLGVLVRSLVSGTDPIVVHRLDAGAIPPAGYVSLVPTQLRRLLDAGAPLDRFRAILLGGAAIPDGMLAEAAAAGARVVTSYGMTETCGGCVYDGVPLDGVTVAQGPGGRIKIAGPVLFSGYRLAPELTAEVLADGWFTTSDLGGMEAGRLVLRGRADDMINSGGEKILAAEVEQVLRGCRGVRDVAVVGVPDPGWGERVTAVVVAEDPADPPTLAGLRQEVADLLPRYAAPQGLVLVTEIAMLDSGKPDRLRLKQIAAG